MTFSPWTQVALGELTTFGLLILGNDAYWQVYFDTNRASRETFAAAGYPAPEQLVHMRSGTTG